MRPATSSAPPREPSQSRRFLLSLPGFRFHHLLRPSLSKGYHEVQKLISSKAMVSVLPVNDDWFLLPPLPARPRFFRGA